MCRRLWGENSDVTAIEGGPIAAPVSVAAIERLGNQPGAIYRSTAAKISAVAA